MLSMRHKRLTGHGHQQVPRGAARHLGDGVARVGHVLEHLDGGGHVELVVGEREVLGLHDPVLEIRGRARLPLRLQRRVLEVDADDAGVAELGGPLVREHALAAADVEQRGRGGEPHELVQ